MFSHKHTFFEEEWLYKSSKGEGRKVENVKTAILALESQGPQKDQWSKGLLGKVSTFPLST